jgi:hypothetical protein
MSGVDFVLCPQGHACSGGAHAKVPCLPGFSAENEGSAKCLRCTPGMYADSEGSVECTKCRPGMYANRDNHTSCLDCPIGKKTEDGQTGATSCQSCGAGEYGAVCAWCAVGMFRSGSDPDATVCKDCPAGYHQDAVYGAACLPCIPGLYQDELGTKVCKKCGINQYTPTSNASECLDCKIGTSTNKQKGSSICTNCQAGKFGATCEDCAVGMYRGGGDVLSAETCSDCKPGFYQLNKGSVACLPKTEGWILTGCKTKTNDIQCNGTERCPVGTYQDDAISNTVCVTCPAGYSSTRGATECETCNKGEYGGKDGLCYPCGLDQYGPMVNTTSCENCPRGWNQPTNGSESCVDLKYKKPGECHDTTQYLDNSNSTHPLTWDCRPCPYGGYCQGKTNWYDVRAKFGYFRVHERTETPPACLLDKVRKDDAEPTCAFARCLHPPACLGASNDEFKHQYHEPATGIDLSQVEFDLNQSSGLLESCDVDHGYKNDNSKTTHKSNT